MTSDQLKMTGRPRLRVVLSRLAFLGLALFGLATRALGAEGDLERKASWELPTAPAVRAQFDALLAETSATLDDATRAKLEALWPADPTALAPDQLLDHFATSLALVSPPAREVVDFCRGQSPVTSLPVFGVLTDQQQPAVLRNNLRLLYGRWLAQHTLYDEALQQLQGLTTDDVVDPAALLFYQGAGLHRMPDKKECLPIVDKLLENEDKIPQRYATVARLIKADLQPLKTDSLDEISRLMDEVQRRLDLQRAGKRVRDQQDEVVAKLDKLIKQLEEQQQQQSSSSAGNLQPSSPAQDSMPMGGKGPGQVDPKQIGSKSGWGNLPPKERQEALQQIGKDLPAHYREVIEEYFRKLAREGGN